MIFRVDWSSWGRPVKEDKMTMPGQGDARDYEYDRLKHNVDELERTLGAREQRIKQLESAIRAGQLPTRNCVIQTWALELPLKMQSVLCLGLRGCDGKNKEDPSKVLLRKLRQTVFNPANPFYMDDPNDNFMKTGSDIGEAATRFLNDLDPYPMHWLMHFLHACEIVGYKHPDMDIRMWWYELYVTAVREGLHLNPEIEDQLDRRLG